MNRYRECEICHHKVSLPDGIDGAGFAGWGVHKDTDLCPDCNTKYLKLESDLNNHNQGIPSHKGDNPVDTASR